MKTINTITCLRCEEIFKVYPYEIKAGRKYCSVDCAEPPLYISCNTCNKEFRISPSRVKANKKYCSNKCSYKGKVGSPGYWTGKKRPDLVTSTSFKKGFIPWNKGIEWVAMQKEGNPRWVGDNIKKVDKRLRRNTEYKKWRKSVYMRDNYTCQICFVRGGELNADHIKPFSLYPELRYELSNGRTLCISCHRKTDTYGRSSIYLKAKEVMPSVHTDWK